MEIGSREVADCQRRVDIGIDIRAVYDDLRFENIRYLKIMQRVAQTMEHRFQMGIAASLEQDRLIPDFASEYCLNIDFGFRYPKLIYRFLKPGSAGPEPFRGLRQYLQALAKQGAEQLGDGNDFVEAILPDPRPPLRNEFDSTVAGKNAQRLAKRTPGNTEPLHEIDLDQPLPRPEHARSDQGVDFENGFFDLLKPFAGAPIMFLKDGVALVLIQPLPLDLFTAWHRYGHRSRFRSDFIESIAPACRSGLFFRSAADFIGFGNAWTKFDLIVNYLPDLHFR